MLVSSVWRWVPDFPAGAAPANLACGSASSHTAHCLEGRTHQIFTPDLYTERLLLWLTARMPTRPPVNPSARPRVLQALMACGAVVCIRKCYMHRRLNNQTLDPLRWAGPACLVLGTLCSFGSAYRLGECFLAAACLPATRDWTAARALAPARGWCAQGQGREAGWECALLLPRPAVPAATQRRPCRKVQGW